MPNPSEFQTTISAVQSGYTWSDILRAWVKFLPRTGDGFHANHGYDVSVKRHEGLVPNGCDATRWRAVLNVIGADITEAAQHRRRLGELYDAERDIGNVIVRTHQTMSAFAALRFVHGYDTKEATRRACERLVGTAHHGEQERLCRVYEAG